MRRSVHRDLEPLGGAIAAWIHHAEEESKVPKKPMKARPKRDEWVPPKREFRIEQYPPGSLKDDLGMALEKGWYPERVECGRNGSFENDDQVTVVWEKHPPLDT